MAAPVFNVAWFGLPIKPATVQSLRKVWVNRTWAKRAVGVPVICNGPSSATSAYQSQNMDQYCPNNSSEVGQLNRNMAWRRVGVKDLEGLLAEPAIPPSPLLKSN